MRRTRNGKSNKAETGEAVKEETEAGTMIATTKILTTINDCSDNEAGIAAGIETAVAIKTATRIEDETTTELEGATVSSSSNVAEIF